MSPTRSSRRGTRGEDAKEDGEKPDFVDEDLTKEEEEKEESEKSPGPKEGDDKDSDVFEDATTGEEAAPLDPKMAEEMEMIKNTEPQTELEIALAETLKRREAHIERLTNEITKLKAFISKRKQTYKRKRKEQGAPTRALSAYNIFVQDRFSKLAKENEQALKSADSDHKLKRVPPASLVATTGNEWKELSAEEKAHYEERQVGMICMYNKHGTAWQIRTKTLHIKPVYRAREDRKRYEEQMAKYQPPDKQANRKRNKTGYNMFFSAHVLRLKQTDAGVPSERGSVARLVGNAWKVSSG